MPQDPLSDAELAGRVAAAGTVATPAYERVKTVLRAQIESGDWPEGFRLPSENRLVGALGLARMTVNRALRDLAAEGLVVRMAGVGTFVAPTKSSSPLFEVRNIADEVQQRGHRHGIRVEFVREEPAGEPHGLWLGPAFHSLLVHSEDDKPIQVEDRYVDPALVPDYGAQDFTAETPNSYLSRIAPLTRGEHVIEAALATERECELLGIPRGEPCLVMVRKTWSAQGLVSVARLVHPGSRSRLEGTFTI
ncbi:histidine utilization repressor [Tsukamurella spumae]|uniref:Histidine utilization repressor n=1 Tax=Tsukamurella spumae TaxID=44753 RepID=A0A846X227_9ACTN|nr:histidine utilization repressor [Tsukamurella spumae]NKY18585.1 histidine utilization repressor [Tsukamurella spumae]